MGKKQLKITLNPIAFKAKGFLDNYQLIKSVIDATKLLSKTTANDILDHFLWVTFIFDVKSFFQCQHQSQLSIYTLDSYLSMFN